MKVVRHLQDYNSTQSTVITMGNFDAMHLGHQLLIQLLIEAAKKNNLISTVVLFEPSPNEFFQAHNAPARLMLFAEKVKYLKQQGVDQVVCLRFNKCLSQLSANDFITQILLQTLHMKMCILGSDARFGYKRQGDIAFLQQCAEQYHFVLKVPDDRYLQQQKISSTYIRELLLDGKMEIVHQLLGRYYSMSGRIIYGNQLGRTLGFPTINIACRRKTVAIEGIFVAKVFLEGYPLPFMGVAHIAKRSIVHDQKPLLEVHLFGFADLVYGKFATVYFLHKIRDTKSVTNLEELKDLIEADANMAKQFLLNIKENL